MKLDRDKGWRWTHEKLGEGVGGRAVNVAKINCWG